MKILYFLFFLSFLPDSSYAIDQMCYAECNHLTDSRAQNNCINRCERDNRMLNDMDNQPRGMQDNSFKEPMERQEEIEQEEYEDLELN